MHNSFGELFRITTFGESHGVGIGVVIDGCPANLPICQEEIQQELDKRKPGAPNTSPRKEADQVEILSGLFEGRTTGAPIALFIRNKDADSAPYDEIRHLYRPGHANFTWLNKYGNFDHRGSGRASARETAARVAAGAVAKKLLSLHDISCQATLEEIGGVKAPEMWDLLSKTKEEGDSLGGVVSCTICAPLGLGEPLYRKMEALLAFAMLSIPASRGFEIGAGFNAARMKGSEHNLQPEGVLGGISTGKQIVFRVAFKPTSSIQRPQATITLSGDRANLCLPKNARHDPCVAIRAVPVVEAMAYLVLADLFLCFQNAQIEQHRTNKTLIGISPRIEERQAK